MNLAEIWDTPGYFYALGYSLCTALVIWFEAPRGTLWKKLLSCGLLMAFLIPFSIATKGTWGLLFVLSMATMVAAILGCVYFNVRNLARAFFLAGKGFIYGEFTSSLCWQVFYALAMRHPALRTWVWRNTIMAAAYAVILVVIYFLERSLHRSDIELQLGPRDLVVEVVIVLSVYVVSNLGYIDRTSLFSGSYARDVFAIRTLVDLCGVMMIYAFHHQLIVVQTRLENDALHSIMENQYQAYQLSRESIDMVNQKYHDLKHQIALLRARPNFDRNDAYLAQMERDIRDYEAQNQTGNRVLDAILTNKSLYCQRHGIELKVIADGALLSFMDDMEVSALFGNMLDNAIESIERHPDEGKRLIRLYVTGEKRFLRIRIGNYCEEKLRFVDGMPVTTKRDKRYHGFGMKSMRRTVEKYGGSMVASQENNWFELKILIPMGATDSEGGNIK